MPEPPPSLRAELESLAAALRRRVAVIADTAWRDADAAAHLQALREVSEDISRRHEQLRGRIHPKLEHFLANCSYEKALDYLESELSS